MKVEETVESSVALRVVTTAVQSVGQRVVAMAELKVE